MRTTRTHLASAAAALSFTFLVTACGGDGASDSSAGGDDGSIAAPATREGSTGPESEECLAAFPMGGGVAPDLADAELVPSDFPESPVEATLCAITGTAQTGVNLGYVSDATAEEVVDGYLEALSAYGAVSEDGGNGVTAVAGDVKLLVVPGFGKYEIHLNAQ